MKKYLSSLIFVLIAGLTFAQDNYQDVVYSKDGSITRGVITEQVPNQHIYIKTPDGKTFVYQMFEVEKVSKEPFQAVSEITHTNAGLQTGIKQIVEAAYLIDAASYGMDGKKVNIISSYQVNPFFSFGAGTGIRYYPEVRTTLIPVFGDVRIHFMDKKVSPYLSLLVGFSYNASENWEKTGGIFNPTAGLSFKLSEGFAMHVGLGLELQNINYYFGTYKEDADAISLNFGFSF